MLASILCKHGYLTRQVNMIMHTHQRYRQMDRYVCLFTYVNYTHNLHVSICVCVQIDRQIDINVCNDRHQRYGKICRQICMSIHVRVLNTQLCFSLCVSVCVHACGRDGQADVYCHPQPTTSFSFWGPVVFDIALKPRFQEVMSSVLHHPSLVDFPHSVCQVLHYLVLNLTTCILDCTCVFIYIVQPQPNSFSF